MNIFLLRAIILVLRECENWREKNETSEVGEIWNVRIGLLSVGSEFESEIHIFVMGSVELDFICWATCWKLNELSALSFEFDARGGELIISNDRSFSLTDHHHPHLSLMKFKCYFHLLFTSQHTTVVVWEYFDWFTIFLIIFSNWHMKYEH